MPFHRKRDKVFEIGVELLLEFVCVQMVEECSLLVVAGLECDGGPFVHQPVVSSIKDTLDTKGTPVSNTDLYEDIEDRFEIIFIVVYDKASWNHMGIRGTLQAAFRCCNAINSL